MVFCGLANGDKDLHFYVRVACAESHEGGFKEAIAAAEKIKTDKYAREVAGISQSAFLPLILLWAVTGDLGRARDRPRAKGGWIVG